MKKEDIREEFLKNEENMLSQTAEYALRAMVWIAGQKKEFSSAPAVAAATKVPIDYLSKILQTLGAASFLDRKRGFNGGFKLKKPAKQISILDIVSLFDHIQQIEQCPLGFKEHAPSLCPLHSKLNHVISDYRCQLSSTSLADLLKNDGFPLCSENPSKQK